MKIVISKTLKKVSHVDRQSRGQSSTEIILAISMKASVVIENLLRVFVYPSILWRPLPEFTHSLHMHLYLGAIHYDSVQYGPRQHDSRKIINVASEMTSVLNIIMSSGLINYVCISVTCTLYLIEKWTVLNHSMSCLRIAYRCITQSKSRSRFKSSLVKAELAIHIICISYQDTVT